MRKHFWLITYSTLVISCIFLGACGQNHSSQLAVQKHFRGYEIEISPFDQYIWIARKGTNVYIVSYDGCRGENCDLKWLNVRPLFGSDSFPKNVE